MSRDAERRGRAQRWPIALRPVRLRARIRWFATPTTTPPTSASRSMATRANGSWSATGNGDIARSVTRQRPRGRERNAIARGDLTTSGDVDITANGPLFAVPAGDASMTVKVGASTLHLDSDRRNAGDRLEQRSWPHAGQCQRQLRPPDLAQEPRFQRARQSDPERQCRGRSAFRLRNADDDRRRAELVAGRQAQLPCQLDPRRRRSERLSSSAIPSSTRPDTRVFDFTTGQTVLVDGITGGNPDLLADKRNVLKFGGNWKPMEEDRPPPARGICPLAARPARLELPRRQRGAGSRLPGSLRPRRHRPVGQRRLPPGQLSTRPGATRLRWGFDFSMPLKSARPSQAAMERFRAAPQRRRQEHRTGWPARRSTSRGRSSARRCWSSSEVALAAVARSAAVAASVEAAADSVASVAAVRADACNSRSRTPSTSSTKSRSATGCPSSTI